MLGLDDLPRYLLTQIILWYFYEIEADNGKSFYCIPLAVSSIIGVFILLLHCVLFFRHWREGKQGSLPVNVRLYKALLSNSGTPTKIYEKAREANWASFAILSNIYVFQHVMLDLKLECESHQDLFLHLQFKELSFRSSTVLGRTHPKLT